MSDSSPKKIKLSEVNLTYRHDIWFRQYVLETHDQYSYETYMRNIEKVKPPKRKRTFDGFMNLAHQMMLHGQQDPIIFEKVATDGEDWLVPRDGAHRIAIMYHREIEDIDIDIIEEVEWKDRSPGYTLDGERSYAFTNVHQDAIEYIKKKAEEHARLHSR